MMRNWKKACGAFVLALALSTACLTQEASASDELQQVKPLEGSQQAAGKTGHGTTQNSVGIQSSQFLMSGSSTIQALSKTKLRVTANTRAYQPVDSISATIYLEKWDSPKSQWLTVLSAGTTTQVYSSYVSTSKDLNVLQNEYYRLRVVHRVLNRGIVEEKTSISSYVNTY